MVRSQRAANNCPAELMVKDTEDWRVALLSKHIEGALLSYGSPSASTANKKYMMAESRGNIDKRSRDLLEGKVVEPIQSNSIV